MKAALVALLSGLLFGSGLLVSGMVNPQVVLAFLDVAGRWNPALAFTMIGALALATPAMVWAQRRGALAPLRKSIDARLVGGAALFGVGWGLSGLCPGPSLVLLDTFTAAAWVFVAAMAVGMLLVGALSGTARAPAPRA